MTVDIARLGMDFDSSSVRRAGSDLDRFQKRSAGAEAATGSLRRESRNLNSTMATLGRTATVVGSAMLAAFSFRQTIGTLAEFGKSMSQVRAITRATGEEFEQMRDLALKMGSSTEFTASQAAGGLKFLGQAGFEASEAVAALPSVLDLATASGMGLAEAADIASNIMSGFGIEAAETARVADILAAASSRSNTNVQQLGQAMKFVAPVADSVGASIEDTAAAIGKLSDAGLQSSRAGTGLRATLAALSKPTDMAQEALSEMGLTAQEINPALNDINDIFRRLGTSGMTFTQAVSIFGREAASSALILAGAADEIERFGKELGMSAGEAKRMADMMRDNLQGDIDGAVSAISGLILRLGDAGLTGALRSVIGGFRDAVQWITTLDGLFDRLASYSVAAAVAGGIALRGVFYSLAASAWALVSGLVATRAALLRTGIGAVVVLAGELIYQFSKLVEASGGFGNAMSLLYDVGAGVFDGLINEAGAMRYALLRNFEQIKAGWYETLRDLRKYWADFLHGVSDSLEGIPAMESTWMKLKNSAIEAGSAVYKYDGLMREAVSNTEEYLSKEGDLLSGAWEKAKDTVNALKEIMDEAGKSAAKTTQDTTDSVNALKEAIDALGGASTGEGVSGAASSTSGSAGGVKAAADNIDKLGVRVQSTTDTINNMGRSTADAFTAIVMGSEKANAAIGNLLQSMGKMMVNRGFSMLMNIGLNALGGGSFLSSGTSSSVLSNAGLSPGTPLIGANANGTEGWRGGLSMVGERGPELVNLPRGSQVIPNDRIAASAGPQRIRVELSLTEDLDARIAEGSRDVSVRVSKEAIKNYDKNTLPGRVGQIKRDPRRRN